LKEEKAEPTTAGGIPNQDTIASDSNNSKLIETPDASMRCGQDRNQK